MPTLYATDALLSPAVKMIPATVQCVTTVKKDLGYCVLTERSEGPIPNQKVVRTYALADLLENFHALEVLDIKQIDH